MYVLSKGFRMQWFGTLFACSCAPTNSPRIDELSAAGDLHCAILSVRRSCSWVLMSL